MDEHEIENLKEANEMKTNKISELMKIIKQLQDDVQRHEGILSELIFQHKDLEKEG
jgi:hypothetical protein